MSKGFRACSEHRYFASVPVRHLAYTGTRLRARALCPFPHGEVRHLLAMAKAEARRTVPNPLELVEIERSFLGEVGTVFWFIMHCFQDTMERIRQSRTPFPAASVFSA